MTRPTVHILDDDAPFRDSLAFSLSVHGLTVTTHGEPLAFLSTFSNAEPSCVICDIRMPGMSGIEVTRALRGRGVTDTIILVTGHADETLVQHALNEGANVCLEKPFPPARLIAIIDGRVDDGVATD